MKTLLSFLTGNGMSNQQKFLVCTLIAISSGCASVFDGSSNRNPKKKKESWTWFKKPEYQEPKSMVAIWTEDTLIQPGKPVTRGFGGRLYFYNEKSQAIPVEGELMVYGFDDSASTKMPSASPSDQEITQSGKKFRFTPEQFTQHFSHSELGASYSVWIPWDAVGGEQKKITLMPTFIGKEQRVIRGESSKLTLSGKTPALAANQQPINTVQLASALIPTVQTSTLPQLSPSTAAGNLDASNQNVGLGLKTTTIRMEQPINWGSTNSPSAAAPSAPTAPSAPSGNVNNSSGSLYQQMQAALTLTQPPAVVPNSVVPNNVVANSVVANNSATPSLGPSPTQNFLPQLGHNVPPTGWVQPSPVQAMPSSALVGSQPSQFPTQGQSTSPKIGHQPPSSLRP